MHGNTGKNVGWDMLPEKENLSCKKDIKLGASNERVEEYVHNLNFTSVVADGLKDLTVEHKQSHKCRQCCRWMRTVDR